MTPRFETINGQLCIMLEKPTPLTKDAKFPCVVRLIQDDSLIGMHTAQYPETRQRSIIITALNQYGKVVSDEKILSNGAWQGSWFEILGYPVEEGSKEWALWLMMQGKAITFFDQPSRVLKLVNGYVQDSINGGYWDRKSGNEFLSYASSTGWKIHEPKPFAKVKVGDWVTDGVVIGYVSSILSPLTLILTALDGNKYSMTTSILIKLKPSEVMVQIGCLRGVVRPLSTNSIHLWFHLVNNKDEVSATIRLTELDPQTRELVEKLLKAQEEEK